MPDRIAFSTFSREKVRLKVRKRDKERGAERINEQKRGGRQFQSDGPIEARGLVWALVVLT